MSNEWQMESILNLNGNLKRRDPLRELDVNYRMSLRWILEKVRMIVWIGLNWFITVSNSGFLLTLTLTLIKLQFHQNEELVARATLRQWVGQICFLRLYQTVRLIRPAQKMQSKQNLCLIISRTQTAKQMQSRLNSIYITYLYSSADAIRTKPLTTSHIRMTLQMQSKRNLYLIISRTRTALPMQSERNFMSHIRMALQIQSRQNL